MRIRTSRTLSFRIPGRLCPHSILFLPRAFIHLAIFFLQQRIPYIHTYIESERCRFLHPGASCIKLCNEHGRTFKSFPHLRVFVCEQRSGGRGLGLEWRSRVGGLGDPRPDVERCFQPSVDSRHLSTAVPQAIFDPASSCYLLSNFKLEQTITVSH